MFIGAIFGIFASFKFGRYLLETYPGFFSLGYVTKAGPPKEKAEGSYFKMTIKVYILNKGVIVEILDTSPLMEKSYTSTHYSIFRA